MGAIGLGVGLGVLLLIAAANFLRETRQAMAADRNRQPWDE